MVSPSSGSLSRLGRGRIGIDFGFEKKGPLWDVPQINKGYLFRV